MTWQVLVIVSVLGGAVMTLIQKVIADRKPDPIAFSIWEQLLAGLLVLVFGLTQGLNFSGIINYWPNLILMVFFWASFNVINVLALGRVQASHFMILFQTKVIWTLLIAVFILKEPFQLRNLVGLLLVILAVIIITPLTKFRRFSKGDFYVILAALCFGLGVGNDAYILKGVASPLSYTVISCIAPAIALAIIWPKAVTKVDFLWDLKTRRNFAVLVVLFAFTVVTTFTAYKIGNAAIIAPLTQTSAVVTVILSMIFLGERDRPVAKVSAILISFLGVLLLI